MIDLGVGYKAQAVMETIERLLRRFWWDLLTISGVCAPSRRGGAPQRRRRPGRHSNHPWGQRPTDDIPAWVLARATSLSRRACL